MIGMRIAAALYAVFLAAALIWYRPSQATELEKMIPLELLWIETDGEMLAVEGKAVKGIGEDWEAALKDLEQMASETVFLETVERVVIAEEAADCLPQLLEDPKLRPSVQLYLLRGDATEKLEAFTSAHPSEAVADDPKGIPIILEEEGRYRIG